MIPKQSEPIKTTESSNPLVFDRSDWGHIRLTGADRVRFLHNQTTQNIEQLSANQGAHTVFVTSTGRTLDLTTVYAQSDSLHVVTSPDMAKPLYDWMDRYIFFSDKVTLADESEQTFMFTLLGPGSDDIARKIGADALMGKAEFSHQQISVAGAEVSMAVGSDLAIAGYTLWGDRAQAETVWQALLVAGATAGSAEQWEDLRIRQGRPMPGKELTDDDNPLEAGLWPAVSFEKGCYIGQETIARLNTYKGVKKRLWGLALEHSVAVGETVWLGEDKIGKVTSFTSAPSDSLPNSSSSSFALAYLRTKAGGEGLTVTVNATEAEVVALPFVTHNYPTTTEATA
ncbi:MAG: folate-binding protein YgfZ [Leptolyngbya foveolarum]|uniref:Folate-binding protein YgfZ n=1 Tax=Leptolyngbya foveolarum TaxID=47253 RepID=A0A2W4U3R0_9CYAN|nr:MAG: folate-binding protein YgfZ [Leptolyngbya foveolarum]